MTRPNKIGCLLMAAGNASRFQSNKLLAEFRGKPLVLWALERIDPARFSQVTVVTQYPEICTMAEEFGFPWLKNDHPDWGAAYTIRLGTEAMAQSCTLLQTSRCWMPQPSPKFWKPGKKTRTGSSLRPTTAGRATPVSSPGNFSRNYASYRAMSAENA